MFVNVDWFFLSHRLPIAKAAQSNDIEMTVFTEFTRDHKENSNWDFFLLQSPLRRVSKSLFHLVFEIFDSFRVIIEGRPDLIHAVTIKPILILGIVARLTSTPFVGAISGLGPAFVADSWSSKIRLKIVKTLFKFVFSNSAARAVCQSVSDQDTLVLDGIISREKIVLIAGSGVDVNVYSPDKKQSECAPYVIMASRMLVDKGVREFCFAAKLIRDRSGDAFGFKLAGPVDNESPSCIPYAELIGLCEECGVEYLGNRADMPQLIASAVLFVLPSYYAEGVPKVLLEASACGVAVVTTDHPGCRDAVVSGKTGVLVRPRDAVGLAAEILRLLKDERLLRVMGESGRQLALTSYRDTEVVEQHYDLYRRQFR